MRVSPQVKAAAEIAAQHENRSVTSLVEVLIINHCKALNIHPENGDTQEPTK
jgi:predicted HicB family RNase H-like nuclease